MGTMTQKVISAILVLVCIVALLRLVIGEHRRARVDAALREAWWSLRSFGRGLKHRKSSREEAERVVEEAIRRARASDVERDGNVYRPGSFRDKDKKNLH
jgi:hypothetical protein